MLVMRTSKPPFLRHAVLPHMKELETLDLVSDANMFPDTDSMCGMARKIIEASGTFRDHDRDSVEYLNTVCYFMPRFHYLY
jgi:hypothetical protein